MRLSRAFWEKQPPGVTIRRGRILDEPGSSPGKNEGARLLSDHPSVMEQVLGPPSEDVGKCDEPACTCSSVVCEPTVWRSSDEKDAAPVTTQEPVETWVRGRLPGLERFWTFLGAMGRGKRTIREYRWEVGWWERHARARGRTVYTLTIGDLEALTHGVYPATARRKLAVLRVLARWLLREGYPTLHTEAGKLMMSTLPRRLPGDKGAQAFVRLREQARQWCQEGRREGIWVGLMLLGGLRVSEVASAGILDTHVKVVGKGVKERIVPIPSWLGAAMTTHRRSGRGGWAQERRMIWRAMRAHQIGKPHALRHTYASELIRRGKPIEEIQVLLGHEDISTTRIYANVRIPDDVADLLDR